jgi:hypothetical protein
MRITLGTRTYDLTHRALVMGALGDPAGLVAEGADIVELAVPDRPVGVPVCVPAEDEHGVDLALAGGASLVRLSQPSPATLAACAAGGAAVIVPDAAAGDAAAAGLTPDRIVRDTLVLDVTGHDCPVAATAVGVIGGARIVRTTDVRGARRVCDVLAAVMEAQ